MQASQGGVAGVPPPVLLRFQAAIGGFGGITGPYRGYLFYWKTTRNEVIDVVTQSLWPYLSSAKREQLREAAADVRRQVPGASRSVGVDTELAWAAGLFDAEGCLYLTRPKPGSSWRGVTLYLAQASPDAAPETIVRFYAAIGGRGTMTGPHAPRSPWSRLPQYQWQTSGRHTVTAVIRQLWPYLGTATRARVAAAAEHLDPDFSGGDS